MAQLVVENLEDEVKEKLQELARSHGRSVEEEAREILRGAVLQQTPPDASQGLGSRIAARFAGIGLTEEEKIQELRGWSIRSPDFDR